jgi:hypothetical protein
MAKEPKIEGNMPEYVAIIGAITSVKSIPECINNPRGGDCKERMKQ